MSLDEFTGRVEDIVLSEGWRRWFLIIKQFSEVLLLLTGLLKLIGVCVNKKRGIR